MTKQFILIAFLFVGCSQRAKQDEYERGWDNACQYVAWKNSYRATLPCYALRLYTKAHPEIQFSSTYFKFDLLNECSQDSIREAIDTTDKPIDIFKLPNYMDSARKYSGKEFVIRSITYDSVKHVYLIK